MVINLKKKFCRFLIYFYQIIGYNYKRHVLHDFNNIFLKTKRDLTIYSKSCLKKKSILIFGCGYNYPDVILYSKFCKNVVGIDIAKSFYKDNITRNFWELKRAGKNDILSYFEIFYKKIIYKRYYRYLKIISKTPVDHKKYKLISYDGEKIPFNDEIFDVVISNAVLEHVERLERVFEEIYRVTKKGGISYHRWHNYYSFSGNHLPEEINLKYPWGHLISKLDSMGFKYKALYLNKLRPEQIKKQFSKFFKIKGFYAVDKINNKRGIDSGFKYEHAELLTEEVKKQLSKYPEDLLLIRHYTIIGIKR